MHFSTYLAVAPLISLVIGQNSTYCTSDSVCYAVNIPEASASSGSGDIFFQISGPSTMSWIGLGQGRSMASSNIFMVYANSAGTNVTLSPRRGVGDTAPVSGSSAQVTLLDGSGIKNGMMVANVKCSNCNSWSGGSMSFTDAGSSWIWGYKSGPAVLSDNLAISLSQHSKYGKTTFNLQNASGGSSSNPFSTTAGAATLPSNGTSGGNSGGASGEESQPLSNFNSIRIIHAVLGVGAFALFFPLGAVSIRILNVKNIVWFHAGWMIFTYLLALAAIGLGIWLALTVDKLDTFHAMIGIIIVIALLLQPVTGWTHHVLYKRRGRGPNAATYLHLWWGRAVITLGIVNGGFGLYLSGNKIVSEIGYAVGAGIVWCLWMFVNVASFISSRRKKEAGDIPLVSRGEKNSSDEAIGRPYYVSDDISGGRAPKRM